MNRLETISKRIIAASVKLGTFLYFFATSSAASALEAIAKLLGKALQDNASATDSPSKAITKPATDAATGSDSNAKTVGKNVSDQLFSTDDINGAGVDDDQNISFFKVLSHPSFVVENIVLLAAFLRSFSNTTTATDSPALLTGKTLADTSEASDAAVKLTGLGKSDTMAAGDAGELLNQDYVDNPNYFLDDYVGVKRTF
jgi:hypothetical protein